MKGGRIIYGAAVALPLAVSQGAEAGDRGGGDERPNIIFILTDDQRWDALGYAGNPVIQTPNMDRLAGEGIYFRNTYATTSISAVSRASILTGQHMRAHGVDDFAKQLTPEQLADTYPMRLRQAGYYVGFIGKYGVGSDESYPSGSFDYWRSFPGQGWYWEKGEAGRGEHLTEAQGGQILDFIRTRDVGRPFCLSVSFKAPHCQDEMRPEGGEEFPPDPRDENLYEDVTIPCPATFDDAYFLMLPEAFRFSEAKNLQNEGRNRWEYRFTDGEMYRKTVKNYYRLITGVDRQIGLLVEELERQGLADNTVIIVMGDNGFYLGEHGLAGKWFAHEESVRLPFFLYDPRLPESKRGNTCEKLALNIDVAPTILSIAGVEVPQRMQGRALEPLYNGKAGDWRREFYYEYTFNPPGVHLPASEGIMGGRYKFVRYHADGEQWFELFDLKRDPHEINNLAGDPAHAKLRKKMEGRMVAERAGVERGIQRE